MPFDKAQREHVCPCGIGPEPCPDAARRPLCSEHERLLQQGWRLDADGCYRKSEPCEYCGPGKSTGLPGNACENCMNTGLKNPTAEDLER